MTTLLAQVISGPAVAAIAVPLAIGSAQRLGLNPQHMALAVALATPMAFLAARPPGQHPDHGPGGYRFTDYFKVGLPLTLVVTLADPGSSCPPSTRCKRIRAAGLPPA